MGERKGGTKHRHSGHREKEMGKETREEREERIRRRSRQQHKHRDGDAEKKKRDAMLASEREGIKGGRG